MTRHENGPRKPTGRTISDRKVARRKPTIADPVRTASPEAGAAAPAGRQRIAKLMARVGLCSRRDAEAWIVDGRVTLNGELLTSPAQDVGPDDKIVVDGMLLPEAEKTRLFLFHKPRGLVTSDHDPEGRQTVIDYLRETWPEGPRVVTIGRLDINTEGLLLLTNDGGLARILELPATGWVRRYRVRAKGETDQAVLDRLRDGLTIEGIEYAGIEAKLDRTQGANSWLTMGLREGKNREIKRVLEHIGLEVNRLIRLSFGPFQLLDLPEGKVEEVRTRVLRDQLGENLAAEAGVDLLEDAPAEPPFRAETRILSRAERPGQGSAGKGPVKGKPGGTSAGKPRGGDWSPTRRDAPRAQAPRAEEPERRQRPPAGTRKHVSSLRAEEAADLRTGPRKRVERTDTKDRKDRTVKVERLVAARPEPRARRGAGRFASRDASPEAGPVRSAREQKNEGPARLARHERPARDQRHERPARDQRHERPARDQMQERPARDQVQERPARNQMRERSTLEPLQQRGRTPAHDHASPSAMAKRVRVARSGGGGAGKPEAARTVRTRTERLPPGERPATRGPTGGKERSAKPWIDAPRAEPARRARGDAPARASRDDKALGKEHNDRGRMDRDHGIAKEKRKPFAGKSRTNERPRGEAKPHVDKPRGEKPRNAGAERRVGERNAGERDARKFGGKRDAGARGGDKPRGPKSPARGSTKSPRASKPRN